MTQGERVKAIRKSDVINLTLEKFGERIGLKKGSLSQIENGVNALTDQTIKTICLQSWNGRYVNEDWLRKGEGEMFLDLPPEDEVAAAVSNILEDIGCENTIYTLLKSALLKYEQLDANSKRVLESYVDDVITDLHEKREEN